MTIEIHGNAPLRERASGPVDKPAPLECDLCDATIGSVTQAIEAGWSPSYFIDDDETGRPICGECAVNRCRVDDESGELVLRQVPRAERLAVAIEKLAAAQAILRNIGGEDCRAAARDLSEMIGEVVDSAGGLRQLLAIWQERGAR